MPHPTLRRPHQSGPVQALLWLLEAVGSLYVAAVLLIVYAVLLVLATYADKTFGSEAAVFGFYNAWWFLVLPGLLALSVVASMAVRFPWKKRHVGFLITHAGILVMLAGCLQTFFGSDQGTLVVAEGDTQSRAFKDTYHLDLVVESRDGTAGRGAEGAGEGSPEPIRVPFVCEPFNWRDYEELPAFPWRLARPDQSVLYDRDGIRLEAVDYWSDSVYEEAPLVLKVRAGETDRGGRSASSSATGDDWHKVSLAARTTREIFSAMRSREGGPALGARAIAESESELPGGGKITCWKSVGAGEVKAFLNSKPDEPLGDKGQLVLYVHGRNFRFRIADKEGQGRFPLGATGVEAELLAFDPAGAVRLRLYYPDESPGQIVLFADRPALNQQDPEHDVFGTFWYDAAAAPDGQDAAEGGEAPVPKAQPRIDLLVAEQAAGNQPAAVYYRAWDGGERFDFGTLPVDGTVGAVLSRAKTPLEVLVTQPGQVPKPLAFDSEKNAMQKRPQVRLRLTVDEVSEEFWLAGVSANPYDQQSYPNRRRVVQSGDRRVSVSMPQNVIDLGFEVKLHWFARRRDPGTERDAGYTSLVDLIEKGAEDQQGTPPAIVEKARIEPNKPIDVADPGTGLSFRLFQASFNQLFDRSPEDSAHGEELGAGRRMRYISIFTLNHDPGRGLKYFGWLMIGAGSIVVFYMKVVFYRKRRRRRRRPYYTASHTH